ncbi:MAG: DUF4345 family protein [Pseudomonadota bacterium]
MVLVLRAILLLGGLFFVLLGASFMLDPVVAGGDFGLQARNVQGLSTIRADFTAYFLVAGGCMIWGAWARNGDPLLVAAALMGVTFCGRAISVYVDGVYDGFALPMIVEAVTTVLALIGSRLLPHHKLTPADEEEADKSA